MWEDVFVGKIPTPPSTPEGGRKSQSSRSASKANKDNDKTKSSSSSNKDGDNPLAPKSRFNIGDRVVASAKTGLAWGIITKKGLSVDNKTHKYKVKLEEGMETGCEVWMRDTGTFGSMDEANGLIDPNAMIGPDGEPYSRFNIGDRVVARVKTGLSFGIVTRKSLSGDGVVHKYKIKLEEGPSAGTEMWLKEPGKYYYYYYHYYHYYYYYIYSHSY